MIKLMKNTFYKEKETKEKLCNFILKSKRLSMGPKVKEFEIAFSKYQGRKYSVLFNSGSSANFALTQSLLNLGILKKSDKVGFSVLTWATNVMPLIQLGLNPIPIDVSLGNLNINSFNLLSVKKNMKALFLTNLLGFCGDINLIKKSCDKKGIILLEDNCESLGSIYKKKLGNFGLASTFSFFVGHHLSTIEGGMVCTDDKELYESLLMVRAHGWNRDLSYRSKRELKKKNKTKKFYDNYTFYSIGNNLRPTEITGFLGLEQLKYVDEICKKRNEVFKEYEKATLKNKEIIPLDFSNIDFVSNFAYPLIFKNKKSFEKYKRKFIGKIEIRPIVGGAIVNQPFFKKQENYKKPCPHATFIHNHGFYIPNNPDLTKNEIKQICNLLK